MQNDVKRERQKKFLLVLPLIVLPFMTFLLWSLGIVGSTKASAQTATAVQGFNMHLPDAKNKQAGKWNKLDFYEQADKDSMKYKEQLKNDPYFSLPKMDTSRGSTTDANEEKVYQKLAQLKTVLNQPSAGAVTPVNVLPPPVQTSMNGGDIDRLQRMLQSINQKGDTTDPEIQQLNAIMDKIIAIQHPETIPAVHPKDSVQNREALTVTTNKEDTLQAGAFYSLDDNEQAAGVQNTIPAVIQETQTLVSGSTVKLRLLKDININGMTVPKDNLVYGIAALGGERLTVTVNSIRYGNNILPVSLTVYDMDGLAGIFIPGAITRDVAKQSADESMQGIGLTTFDPSIGAQAASAGIQTVKTLLGKKVRLVKVTVKAGYQVLLRDNNLKK